MSQSNASPPEKDPSLHARCPARPGAHKALNYPRISGAGLPSSRPEVRKDASKKVSGRFSEQVSWARATGTMSLQRPEWVMTGVSGTGSAAAPISGCDRLREGPLHRLPLGIAVDLRKYVGRRRVCRLPSALFASSVLVHVGVHVDIYMGIHTGIHVGIHMGILG